MLARLGFEVDRELDAGLSARLKKINCWKIKTEILFEIWRIHHANRVFIGRCPRRGRSLRRGGFASHRQWMPCYPRLGRRSTAPDHWPARAVRNPAEQSPP